MSKRAIVLILIAALLLVSAARPRVNQNTVSVWTLVKFEPSYRPCAGLSNYFEPCPGCVVWIRWPEHVPGEPIYPMRLDGYVTDEPGHCQVLNVTAYTTCHK